jgi:hypothetical protein
MNKLIFAAAVAAIVVAPVMAQEKKVVEPTDTTAAAIVADCNARKFETSVEIEKGGQKRLTKLRLCAAKDEDEVTWVKTLKDAKAKIAGHPDISADSKAKIAAELDAEIARLETGGASISSSVPVQPPAPTAVASPSAPIAPATIAAPTSTLAQSLTKPRLTVRCLEPGEHGDGQRCISLEHNTRLAIRADGDLISGASLRFLRRGDVRGEIALARMQQGQSVQLNLPPQLCAGVASSKVEIQILGSNQVVETLGPYMLRC